MTSGPRCASCKKPREQHKARTFECPRGPRTRAGYTDYGPGRFVTMVSKELRRVRDDINKLAEDPNTDPDVAASLRELENRLTVLASMQRSVERGQGF